MDAFERALEDCLPANRILSHDLIEGCYARSGLTSDIQVYEEYPACYSADAKRHHRWIRGDWQLLPWLLSCPPSAGCKQATGLDALGRWKIFDNLRRSLEPAAFLCGLLWAWFASSQPLLWVLAIIALVVTQPLLGLLHELLHKPPEVPLRLHLTTTLRSSGSSFHRALLPLVWLPFETLNSLDAIGRTLWRILVSHRNLLQWNPSRQVERGSRNDLSGLYRLMWVCPALATSLFILLIMQPLTLVVAAPFLLAWSVAPALAWWLSQPSASPAFEPTARERRFLRQQARRNWAFFEDLVGPADNWLPPDNIQEQPVAVTAQTWHWDKPAGTGERPLRRIPVHNEAA